MIHIVFKVEVALSGILTHNQWTPFRCSNQLSYQAMMSLTCTQKQLCTSALMSSFVQCSDFIMVIAFVSTHIYSTFKAQLVTKSLAEWIAIIFTIDGFFRSSNRKLPWIEFEPTITWFCSNALSEVSGHELNSHSVKFVQLLQLHFWFSVQISFFILTIVSRHIYHNWSFTQTITQVIVYMESKGLWKQHLVVLFTLTTNLVP